MIDVMTPRNELERQLLNDPPLRTGLDWGTPRFGHPEGRVAERYTSDERLLSTLELHELAIAGRLPSHPRTAPNEPNGDVVFVKASATSPEQQAAVANAATDLVAEQRRRIQADGEVLASDDGRRVVLQWHGHGSRRDVIERDAEVIREALAAHPILAEAQAAEARIFHTTTRH